MSDDYGLSIMNDINVVWYHMIDWFMFIYDRRGDLFREVSSEFYFMKIEFYFRYLEFYLEFLEFYISRTEFCPEFCMYDILNLITKVFT